LYAVCRFQIDSIASMNRAGFHDPAKNPTPPAESLLKSIANFIHLVAWRAGLGDFEQRITHAKPLPER
jgi:hypothetical protein